MPRQPSVADRSNVQGKSSETQGLHKAVVVMVGRRGKDWKVASAL